MHNNSAAYALTQIVTRPAAFEAWSVWLTAAFSVHAAANIMPDDTEYFAQCEMVELAARITLLEEIGLI